MSTMANINHFKIKNSHVNIKVSSDKDDPISNSRLFNVNTKNSAQKNPDLQKQSTFDKCERERHEQEVTESDSDTDTDNQPNDTYFNSSLYRNLKLDETRVKKKAVSQLKEKTNQKRLKMHTSKTDELIHNTFKDITKLCKKSKITRILSKTFINGITRLTAYPMGSYFDGEQSVSSQDLSNERIRFHTFYGYLGNGDPRSLSRGGFYYDHAEGQYSTRCFRCNVAYSQWANNDDVSSVHRRLSPNCAFLNRDGSIPSDLDIHGSGTNTTRRNSSTASGVSEAQRYINLASEKQRRESGAVRQNAEAALSQQGFPTVDRFDNSNYMTQPSLDFNQSFISQEFGDDRHIPCASALPAPFTQTSQNTAQMSRPLSSTRAEQRMSHLDVPWKNPKYPEKSSLESRVCSFQRWTGNVSRTPSVFADAGLFYTGIGDLVRCFYCGIGIQDWEADDDPMVEHAHWSANCEYLKQLKGDGCVAEIQIRLPENMAGQREQHDERTDRKDDSDVTAVVCRMQEMGYSANQAKRAAHEVLQQQTGGNRISLEQVLNWYLDHEQTLGLHAADETGVTASSSSLPSGASRSSDYSQGVRCIQEENRKLREIVMCKICIERSVHITFLPCGHLVCCENCAALFQQCPECNVQILGRMTMRL